MLLAFFERSVVGRGEELRCFDDSSSVSLLESFESSSVSSEVESEASSRALLGLNLRRYTLMKIHDD